MRLDGLTIALRARSPWESVDLGIALLRANARCVYAAWVLTTLPVFVLLNAVCWAFDTLWLAPLLLWYLKPVFDRVPLFVISRAVFGTAPSLRETLQAQLDWGWRGVLRWMHWRRLHPGRAMLLPVDLLEGIGGARRAERVRVLTRSNASPNVLLTIIGVNLEAVFFFSIILLGLMFVPSEFFSDAAKAVWESLFEDPPRWAQALVNLLGWVAITIVEPFFVGAGFGLYLNRRMQLEGWDIELAFRRMAARLARPLAAAALLLLAAMAAPLPASAQQCTRPPDEQRSSAPSPLVPLPDYLHDPARDWELRTTLPELFGDAYRDDGALFAAAVGQVYRGEDLSPKVEVSFWRRRVPIKADKADDLTPGWVKATSQVFAFIAKYGLWILVVALLGILLANHRRWLPWIADRIAPGRMLDAVETRGDDRSESLPDDVVAAVRELLQGGRVRDALSLLYRAGVQRLAAQFDIALPPGATESDCLRRARDLRDRRYAALFERIVRSWQGAAYAQRPPSTAAVEALLSEWSAPPEPAT